MRVRVLVEDDPRAPAQLLGLARIGDEFTVGRHCLLRALHDHEGSRPGSNQRSMPSCGFETIAAPEEASSNGRAVDEPATVACGRRVMLRFTRAAEIARAKTLKGCLRARAPRVSP